MSVTEDDKKLLEAIKSHLASNYDITRFLKDAGQGLRRRKTLREKMRRYRERKDREEYEEIYGTKAPEKPVEVVAEAPAPAPAPAPEPQEKERRPSLLNLAEIQAKFQQGLKEGTKEIVLPPIIGNTKTKK